MKEAAFTLDYICKLEAEKLALQDQVDVLKGALAEAVSFPREWKLTRMETAVLQTLAKREVASKEAFRAVLYSDRTEDPGSNIISVYIHDIRKKLKPFGIEIHCVWGIGYRLDPDSRGKLAEIRPAA